MAYLLASIPYIHCLVRKEYTRDLADGHGQYLPAIAVGVMAVRGDALHFQVIMKEPLGGCAFLLPIEALTTKESDRLDGHVAQPWDCFSSDIGVCELTALRRGVVKIPAFGKMVASYRFTIASTGTDVADDPAQRKLLHVLEREDGPLLAMPNNRIAFHDRALFGDLIAKPEFTTLSQEFRAEGVRSYQRKRLEVPVAGPTSEVPNGEAREYIYRNSSPRFG